MVSADSLMQAIICFLTKNNNINAALVPTPSLAQVIQQQARPLARPAQLVTNATIQLSCPNHACLVLIQPQQEQHHALHALVLHLAHTHSLQRRNAMCPLVATNYPALPLCPGCVPPAPTVVQEVQAAQPPQLITTRLLANQPKVSAPGECTAHRLAMVAPLPLYQSATIQQVATLQVDTFQRSLMVLVPLSLPIKQTAQPVTTAPTVL